MALRGHRRTTIPRHRTPLSAAARSKSIQANEFYHRDDPAKFGGCRGEPDYRQCRIGYKEWLSRGVSMAVVFSAAF
jgi:hypothetical protein